MRKVILTIHLAVAFAAGVFMMILGITGAVIAFDRNLIACCTMKLPT